MWAAWWGNSDNVKVLIDAGADVTARDKDGETPLQILERKYEDSEKARRLLANAGSSVDRIIFIKFSAGLSDMLFEVGMGRASVYRGPVSEGMHV